MRLAARLPAQTVVSRVFKKQGDLVAFGEPVALLQTSATNETKYVFSPIVGQITSIDMQAQPGRDFATFEGRKPLIGFRHVKAKQDLDISSPAAAASAAPAAAALGPAPFSELPPSFGRLPPLTDKESALLHSGLATDAAFW